MGPGEALGDRRGHDLAQSAGEGARVLRQGLGQDQQARGPLVAAEARGVGLGQQLRPDALVERLEGPELLLVVRQPGQVGLAAGLLGVDGDDDDRVAPLLPAGDEHVLHEGRPRVHALQLLGVDELAVGELELPADAAPEGQEAVLVHAEQIAGAVPELARRLLVLHQHPGGLVRLVEVAPHDVVAAHPQLAHGLRIGGAAGVRRGLGAGQLGALVADDLHLEEGAPHGAGPPAAQVIGGDQRRALGDAVALRRR